MAEYYQCSGKFAPTAIIVIPACTAVISSILGIFYSYLTWYNPIIYIGIVFPLIYAYATYRSSSWILYFQPVRQPLLAFILFFAGGVVGYVFHCMVWLNLFINKTDTIYSVSGSLRDFGFVLSDLKWGLLIDEVLHLSYSFNYLSLVIEQGVWTINGQPFLGFLYRMVWIVEFLSFTIILGVLSKNKAGRPFCEYLGQYLPKLTLPHLVKVPYEIEPLLYRFEKGEYGYVMAAVIEPDKANNHLKLDLYYLDDVEDAYLTVTLVLHSKKIEEIKLIEYVGIPSIQAEILLRRYGEDVGYKVRPSWTTQSK